MCTLPVSLARILHKGGSKGFPENSQRDHKNHRAFFRFSGRAAT